MRGGDNEHNRDARRRAVVMHSLANGAKANQRKSGPQPD
jgi:hypothetical protein